MRRGRRCVVGIVGAALLAACSSPAGGQEDRSERVDATVTGVVVGADGAPMAGVEVVVTETDTGIGTGPVIGLFTLGVGCLAGLCGSGSSTVDRTTTAADGSYEATLPRAYRAGTETDEDWVVSVSLPATGDQRSGPASAFEFEANIQLQEAPPLPLWTRDPQVSVDGWAVSIDVGAVPPGLEGAVVNLETPRLKLRQEGTAATFDARLLEFDGVGSSHGLAANGTAFADRRVPHANGRTIYHQRTTTAIVPIDLHLVPSSRGAPCTARSTTGLDLLPGGPEAGCPLTDGNLLSNVSGAVAAGTAAPEGTGGTTATTARPTVGEATIDLLDPIEASLVVLRGVEPGPVVDLSLDGATWTTVRTVAATAIADGPRTSVAAPPASATARYVRVRHPAGVDPGEVSVWTPRPVETPPPPAGGADPTADAPARPADEAAAPAADDEGGAIGAELLAVVLAAGAWLAVGTTLRRHGLGGPPPAPGGVSGTTVRGAARTPPRPGRR